MDVNKNDEVKSEFGTKERVQVETEEWTGKRLLTMAGIFDVWKRHDSAYPLYSFTVITVDVHYKLSWTHDRMPAIPNGDEEVNAWLDYESVPLKKALNLIRSTDCVQWHAVSSLVNNSRNQSEECVKPYVPVFSTRCGVAVSG